MTSLAAYPPGPVTRFPAKHIFSMGRDLLGFFRRLEREYGDIAHFQVNRKHHTYLLSHPDLIRDVLVTQQKNFMKGRGLERAKRLLGNGLLTSEGEFHLRQRRLAQPAFHRQRVAAYADVMSRYAARVCAPWRDGETLDVSREMMRLTLAIAAKTLFDADVESESAEIGEALTTALDAFSIAILPYSELLDHLPLPRIRGFERARATLDATIYRIIEERRRSGEDRGDLLSMLLLARDEEGDGGRMTDEQLRDEAMTIFLAGHETTAIALSWTWYLLSQHPDVERRLHAEVDAVLREADGPHRLPSADDVPHLDYARRVLAEVDATVSAGVGARAALVSRLRDWRLCDSARLARPGVAIHRASRCEVVAEPGTVRSGPLASGRGRRTSEVRVFPVRWRNANLHRRAVRVDGGDPGTNDNRVALATAARA
jgi:cytochrome P450